MTRRFTALLAIALVGASLDLATKARVFATHPYGRSWPVLRGVAWIECSAGGGPERGLLPPAAWAVFALAAAGALVAGASRSRSPGRLETAAGGLILAGLLGNAWDRLTLGAVRHFIRVGKLEAFNGADVLAVLGCVLLSIVWILHDRRPLREAGPAGAGQPPDGRLGDVGRDHGPGP